MGDLIERLEAATVGSRELDVLIWNATGGWPGVQAPPSFTGSLDAALALAERVLDAVTALALLHAVIEVVGSNGWPSSRIPTFYCAAILRAIPEDKS